MSPGRSGYPMEGDMTGETLQERIEAFGERWRAAQAEGDEGALSTLRAEGQALAAEVQAAKPERAADGPDVEATAALDEALTAAVGAGDEAAADDAWRKVPAPAGPRDEAAAIFEDWSVERHGNGDGHGPLSSSQLARAAPAYVRRVHECLFPGEAGAGVGEEAALMDAIASAYEEGGVEAAREAWRKQEEAGIDVAPADLWAQRPAGRDWLVPRWLPRGRVGLFTGEGGAGKSRAALQLAVSLAAGEARWIKPFANKGATGQGGLLGVSLHAANDEGEPVPVHVAIATWEDESAEIARRVWNLGAAGPWGDAGPDKAAADELGKRLHVADLAGAGPLWAPKAGGSGHVSTMGALTGKGRWLRRFCEDCKVRLLIVDPLAAAFALNENDRGLVRGFMADWDRWGRDADCAVLLIAHPPKGDSDWSGSTDWYAASRAVWTLGIEDTGTGEVKKKANGDPIQKDGKDVCEKAPAPRLACIKSSYGKRPDEVWLRHCGDGWLADDARGAGQAAGGGHGPAPVTTGTGGGGAGQAAGGGHGPAPVTTGTAKRAPGRPGPRGGKPA